MECPWCYYEMGVEKMHSAEYYDMLLRMYKGNHKLLLSGGEPTIRPDFFDFVWRLSAYGWPVGSITNMIQLADKEFFAKTLNNCFIDNGIYKFCMSMQHPKWYPKSILEKKIQALENMEAEKLSAICSWDTT